MQDKIKIVIIEDHALVREGIKAVINQNKKMEIIGEADNIDEGYSVTTDLCPDILLPGYFFTWIIGTGACKKTIKKTP